MLTKVVNIHHGTPYDIYIGRGPDPRTGKRGIWGNPFRLGSVYNGVTLDRDSCLEVYESWLSGSAEGVELQSHLPELKDKTLGCWCKPAKCHGDILAEMAEAALMPFKLKISTFRDEFSFLSNFHACAIDFDGEVYPSVEHAFQAAKTLDRSKREWIAAANSAGEAKRRGRQVPLRPEWECIKHELMYSLLRDKFCCPVLGKLLMDTGDAELIEGNWWCDTEWGVCGEGYQCSKRIHLQPTGENLLGQMLMAIRKEIGGR